MNTKDVLTVAAVGFLMYMFLDTKRKNNQVSLNTINYAWPNGKPNQSNPYLDMREYTSMPFTGINFLK